MNSIQHCCTIPMRDRQIHQSFRTRRSLAGVLAASVSLFGIVTFPHVVHAAGGAEIKLMVQPDKIAEARRALNLVNS